MSEAEPGRPALDRAKLAAARLAAASKFPYLASALFALTTVERAGIGTIATDERWRLYIDPAVVEPLDVGAIAAKLVHHVSHLLRDHAARATAVGVDAQGATEWLRATDAEIDDDLVEVGMVAPDADSLPSSFGAAAGRLAEEYFGILKGLGTGGAADGAPTPGGGAGGAGAGGDGAAGLGGGGGADEATDDDDAQDSDPGDATTGTAGGRSATPGKGASSDPHHDPSEEGDEHDGDCGSGAHGVTRPWDQGGAKGPDGATVPGLDAEAAALLSASVAQATRAHARAHPGTVPGGWVLWANQLLEPVVDWRRALAAEVRRGVHNVAGRVDYSYRRPSRRSVPGGRVILPSLHRPVPEVAVVCDTSGSMDGLLDRVVAEVEGILVGVGLRAGQVRVLCVDTDVHGGAQRVRRASDVTLSGGGGTDMGRGIAAAAELRPKPKVVVVLTDGMTPWPGEAPRGVSVVVGLVGTGAPLHLVPSWARSVVIEPDEI